MQNKKSGNHWGNTLFGLIIGGLVVATIFGSGKQIVTYSIWLVLFAAGFVIRWAVLKVWVQNKTPAVVTSTVNYVVEPQAQPVSAPVIATQPAQQINKTVVVGVIAAVFAVAAVGYVAIVISANQQYELAVAEQEKAMGAWNRAINARVEAERAELAFDARFHAGFDETLAKITYEASTDAVEKAQLVRDYPLASLFKKADVE